MGNWNDLSIKEKAELIHLYMDGGMIDLPSIRKHYNSFAGGGDTVEDEEIEDFILPSVKSSRYLKPYSRRAIRAFAKEDARSGDTSTFTENAVTKKQRLYNKVYQRQAEKEEREFAEQERRKALKRAAVEELQTGVPTGAFKEYTREGIDDAAPFAMGVVGASAAPWLIEGAMTAGPYMAKGFDLMSKYAMPSALTKGAAYYLPAVAKEAAVIGQVGDAAALAYWLMLGARGAKRSFENGNAAQGTAEAVLSALPFIPVASGMYREGQNAWRATSQFRKDLNKWYNTVLSPSNKKIYRRRLGQEIEDIDYLVDEYEKLLKETDYAFSNYPEIGLKRVRKNSRIPINENAGTRSSTTNVHYGNMDSSIPLETFETSTGRQGFIDRMVSGEIPAVSYDGEIEATRQFPLRWEPGQDYASFTGENIGLSGKEYGFNPALRRHRPISYDEVLDTKIPAMSESLSGFSGNETSVFSKSGITFANNIDKDTRESAQVLSEYRKYMQDKLKDRGVVTGSNVLYSEGAASGVPGDTEILTIDEFEDDVKRAIQFSHDLGSTDLVHEGHSPIALAKEGQSKGKVDVQRIAQNDAGNATGRIAWQMFRTMHPEECARAAELSAHSKTHYTNTEIINPNTGRPYTPKELLNEFINGDYVLQYEVDNALGLLKHYDAGTKILKETRPLAILTSKSPSVKAAVARSIDNMGRSQVGEQYIKGSEIYQNLDFSNIEDNKAFLDRLGLGSLGLENDEEAVRNIFDYWYMQHSCQKRSVQNLGNASVDAVKGWVLNSNFARNGGTFSGAGRNTLSASKETMAFGSYPYMGASQTHLTTKPENIKSLADITKQVDRLQMDSKVDVGQAKSAILQLESFLFSSDATLTKGVNQLQSDLYAADNVNDVSNAIVKFSTGAFNKGISERTIEEVIETVSDALDMPFITSSGYQTNFGTAAYRGILRKSSPGRIRYFNYNDASFNEVPFEFGKDIEGYKLMANSNSAILNSNSFIPSNDDIVQMINDVSFSINEAEKTKKAFTAGTLRDLLESGVYYRPADSARYSFLDLPDLVDTQYVLYSEIKDRMNSLNRLSKFPGFGKQIDKHIVDINPRGSSFTVSKPSKKTYDYIKEIKPKAKESSKGFKEDFDIPW